MGQVPSQGGIELGWDRFPETVRSPFSSHSCQCLLGQERCLAGHLSPLGLGCSGLQRESSGARESRGTRSFAHSSRGSLCETESQLS